MVSEAERVRRTLSAGVLVFRWASFGWMTVLNLTASEPFRHPVAAWVFVGAAGLFTVWLSVSRAWDEPLVLCVDLALSVGLILASGYVVRLGEVVTGRLFFATAYPVSTALAWGAAWGPWRGLAASVVLGVAGALSRPINGVSFGELDAGQLQSLANGAVNFVLAAVAAGVVSRLLRRSSEQVRLATDEAMRERERSARLAERDALARAIHDSVLQALALIHKRGRELGETKMVPAEELRHLSEVAGRQEAALRSLILREPDRGPSGTSSLRARLESMAAEIHGPEVTVSTVGSIWLPAADVEEVAAAVRQALVNVVEHAAASRVSVFAETEDGWVSVSVRDDGRGFQYDEARLRAQEKVGILLSMKGRVEDLGGHMTVQSRPEHGTEIEFRIPMRTSDD
ncbi:MAG: sensor histidine kinase [Actinomycetota bacterium]